MTVRNLKLIINKLGTYLLVYFILLWAGLTSWRIPFGLGNLILLNFFKLKTQK